MLWLINLEDAMIDSPMNMNYIRAQIARLDMDELSPRPQNSPGRASTDPAPSRVRYLPREHRGNVPSEHRDSPQNCLSYITSAIRNTFLCLVRSR